jgi:hypothetical protein
MPEGVPRPPDEAPPEPEYNSIIQKSIKKFFKAM